MIEHLSREELKALQAKPKANKYRAKAIWVDGLYFQSKKEAKRWAQLKILLGQASIKNLRRQVSFPLHVNGKKVSSYRADFTYEDEAGAFVVEDAKGVRCELYKLKKKMMAAQYGIIIREV